MQDADRQEFSRGLEELFAAFDKPFTRAKDDAFWKALRDLSLVEFGRCCARLVHDLSDGEARRSLGVSDIWAARRKMRALAPEKPHDDGWRGDGWDLTANRRLLQHIRGLSPEALRSLGEPPSYMAMKAGPAELRIRGLDRNNLDASPAFVTHVGLLTAFKNAWARDMREEPDATAERQRVTWDQCMARALEEIRAQ